MEDEYLNALSDIDETLADYVEPNKKMSDAVDDVSSDIIDEPVSEEIVPEDEIDDIAPQSVIQSEDSNEEILNQLNDLISVSSNSEDLQEEELDIHEEYYKKMLTELEQLNTAAAVSSDIDPEESEEALLHKSINTLVETNSESNNELITQLEGFDSDDENSAETQMYLNMMDSISLDTADAEAPINVNDENEESLDVNDTATLDPTTLDDNALKSNDIIDNELDTKPEIITEVSEDIVEKDNAVEQLNDINAITTSTEDDDDDDDYDDDDYDDDDSDYDTFNMGDVQMLGKTNAELDTISENALEPVDETTQENEDNVVEDPSSTEEVKMPSLISRVSEEEEMAMLFKSMKSDKNTEDSEDIDDSAVSDATDNDVMVESLDSMKEDSTKLTKALEDSINETQISNELSTQQSEQLNENLEKNDAEQVELNENAISEEQITEEATQTPTIIEKEAAPEVIKIKETTEEPIEEQSSPNTVDVKEETPKQEQQTTNNINNTESTVNAPTQNFDKMEELLIELLQLNARMLDIQMKNSNTKSIHKLKNGPISN